MMIAQFSLHLKVHAMHGTSKQYTDNVSTFSADGILRTSNTRWTIQILHLVVKVKGLPLYNSIK